MCLVSAERLIEALSICERTDEILAEVQDLRRRLLDQVRISYCLALSKSKKELYQSAQPLFGVAAETAFPSASEDIYEAAKCLGLNRATACVMHLMRVVEAGLAALGNTIGVPKQNDWGAYLRKIDEELQSRLRASGARSADEQFYAEAAITIDGVRRAWRNPSMHVDRSYSVERAREIREAVKSFMTISQRLWCNSPASLSSSALTD